jgi:carbonic anhydrase
MKKMKKIFVVVVFTIFALIVNAQEQHHSLHWSYAGEASPEHWGDLSPDFSACKSGREQSPINITSSVPSDVSPIIFDYKPSVLKIVDNGHTVQVNYDPGSSIRVGDKQYKLLQFHFHHPSEEEIDGKSYDLVAHLVHADTEGHLAVVAVLFSRQQSNPFVETIFAHLPKSKGKEETANVTINVADLLPKDRSYYTFPGSLTTPPCSEGVTWFVLKTPVTLSTSELTTFAKIYPNNARPVQALNDRKVLSGR